MTFTNCQCEIIYYCDFWKYLSLVSSITQSRAVTLAVIAHLEETPVVGLIEHMKLLFKPMTFCVWGEFHSIKQLVIDWTNLK